MLGAALTITIVLLAAAVPFSSDSLRERIVATLSDRLNSDVTLGEVSLRLFPRMHAVGTDLVVRQRNRGDVPPLFTIKRFEVRADLAGLLRKRVAQVELEGLDIQIPPGRRDGTHEGVHPGSAIGTTEARVDERPASMLGEIEAGIVIDRVVTENARLTIISSKANKPGRVWDIHTLRMDKVGIGRPMPYHVTLTNAIPRGDIVTEGTFGPWQRDEPGDTPLDGSYTFDKADLSIFKGIAGTLSSRGAFHGTLDRIDAIGETETPDFTIRLSGRGFPLRTKFHSIIDGTNGDTILEKIEASFLESSLVASGSVLGETRTEKGRVVSLDVDMQRARLEDIMHMSVKSDNPPMTGTLKLKTTFRLPPGDTDISERLELEGDFEIASARFTNFDIQAKIQELSKRGRGVNAPAGADRVVSNFQGHFQLGGGVLRLPTLQFSVPGAVVRLAGNYALETQRLDFNGDLLMDAKVSETTTGIKSVLLKVVDPLFRQKDGTGSALPIKITGRRDAPQFGLDLRRALRRGR